MPSLLLLPFYALALYLLTFPYGLLRNILIARKCNLPTIWTPTDPNHIVWMLTITPLRKKLKVWLPDIIYRRLVLSIYGWEFHEKFRPNQDYGKPQGNEKTYLLVTCNKIELWSWDAEVVREVLWRPRDFVQMEQGSILLNRFGENVLTSDGEVWARHRKVIATAINERISKAVFDETIRQTEGMLKDVGDVADEKGTAETSQLFDWAKRIAIHILDNCGMGDTVPWDSHIRDKPEPGYKQTYIQTVKTLIDNITGGILLPRWFLHNYPAFLPGAARFKVLGYAVDEFPVHTRKLLDRERQRTMSDSSATKSNILSQLLKASAESDGAEEKAGGTSKALTDDDVLGNLFVFTAAAFDSTANTVAYAYVLLARYPQWQSWILEEIDQIYSTAAPDERLEYTSTFPGTIRLQALLFETLRLFPPLIHLSKQTKAPQGITTSSGTYIIPTDTMVYVNAVCLHLDPKVWRNLNLAIDETPSDKDETVFRPTRWITPSGGLYQPPKGTYVPWSAGPRVCPGQKMAQVEFIAIFLTLLKEHRIDAAALRGEGREEVERRLDERMKDSISILTLQMRDVYDVGEDRDDKGLKMRISRRK